MDSKRGSRTRRTGRKAPESTSPPIGGELAWLAFNERVLGEAELPGNPLLERLKFLVIFHRNLDEFFMVRLVRLIRLVDTEKESPGTPPWFRCEETLEEVNLKVRDLTNKARLCLEDHVLPVLAQNRVHLVSLASRSEAELAFLEGYFHDQVLPLLTPLAVDPAHPFPYLSNLALYLAVEFLQSGPNGETLLGFVELPPQVPRLVPLPGGKSHSFILLEDLVRRHLGELFPWTSPRGAHLLRVTRNLDYHLLESDVKDLMESVEEELRDRAPKIPIRLEVEEGLPPGVRDALQMALGLDPLDAYEVRGMLAASDLEPILALDLPGPLRFPPFLPRVSSVLGTRGRSLFEVIRAGDVCVHHPYESFQPVLRFLVEAASDPAVLAIKQTLYRIGGDSAVLEALTLAAGNGKQVTVVVELKARFDERNNIVWAKKLEQAGVHVVFGFVGLKTHVKSTLVIRNEPGGLRHYAHLSTGNYNSTTAKVYVDIGLFTCDPGIGADLVSLFNILTGFNVFGRGPPQGPPALVVPVFNKLLVAPFRLREQFLQMIARVAQDPGPGPKRIVLKMNSLIDPVLVEALCEASQRDVRVDLIVRGVCALRPGIPGVSEGVRVISVIDRFLEHSRAYWFESGGSVRVYLGSADFMARNMDRRVEVVWPVLCPQVQGRLGRMFEIYLEDNQKAHEMQLDGSYVRVRAGRTPARCQERFIGGEDVWAPELGAAHGV